MDELSFEGPIWYWRGPAPHHFMSVPEEHCDYLRAASKLVTYGWGMVPVRLRIGNSEWKTALWPKDGGYIVPIKAAVRKREGLEEGSTTTVHLEVMPSSRA